MPSVDVRIVVLPTLFMPLVRKCNFLILSIVRLCVLYARSVAINSYMRTVARTVLTLQMKVLSFSCQGGKNDIILQVSHLILSTVKISTEFIVPNCNILKRNYWKE